MKNTVKKEILIASDHAGFELKGKLLTFLHAKGYHVRDMGPSVYRPDDDYPLTLAPLCKLVSEAPQTYLGIVIGGSGQGEAMIANRYPNIRATVYYAPNDEIIALSRQHNDANVLALGARFLSAEEATRAVEHWLTTDFPGEERHKRRTKQMQ